MNADGPDSTPTPERDESGAGRGRLATVLAVVVAFVVVAGVVAFFVGRDEDDDTITGAEAADALVEAYTRSLDATYRIEGEFSRTLPDGRTMRSAYLAVQRPPDRLQRSLGSTSGVINGRSVNCSTPSGGSYTCAATGEATSWDEEREDILDGLDQYVRGDDPVYAVTTDGSGCFDLVRRRTVEEASFGQRAQLCFDPTYAGYRRLEVVREGGAVDVMLAAILSDQVSAADFDLDADATYDPVVPDSVTSPPTTSQEPPS